MSTQPTSTEQGEKPSFRFSRKQSIGLVFGCTLFGAAAQMLIKSGANSLESAHPIDMLTNPPLFFGYGLYGFATILLVLALRDGELSILYPVISLTFAWVAILSVLIFGETVNPYKVIGVAVIIGGVAVLGRDSRQ